MFNMDEFNRELDEQNAALESLLSDMDDLIAEESLLASGSTADDMLAAVRERVEKCESADDCQELMDKLNKEIDSFNDALDKLKEASKKFQDDGDKKALKDAIKPVITDLKKKCNVIEMKDIDEDTDSIEDDEIKKLRDFLTGSRDIIQEKSASFENEEPAEEGKCGKKGCCESFLDSIEDSELDIAEEGLKETLENLKKAVLTWFDRQISKFQGLFKKEKDSKKKSLIQKVLSIFNRNKSKVNSAKDAEECKSIKDETLKETEKFYDDIFDSQYAPESFTDDPYEKMVEAAYEACVIAQSEYKSAIATEGLNDAKVKIVDIAISLLSKVQGMIKKHIQKLRSFKGQDKLMEKWQKKIKFWDARYEKLGEMIKHLKAKNDSAYAFKSKEFAEKTKDQIQKECDQMEYGGEASVDYAGESLIDMEDFAMECAAFDDAYEEYMAALA